MVGREGRRGVPSGSMDPPSQRYQTVCGVLGWRHHSCPWKASLGAPLGPLWVSPMQPGLVWQTSKFPSYTPGLWGSTKEAHGCLAGASGWDPPQQPLAPRRRASVVENHLTPLAPAPFANAFVPTKPLLNLGLADPDSGELTHGCGGVGGPDVRL